MFPFLYILTENVMNYTPKTIPEIVVLTSMMMTL